MAEDNEMSTHKVSHMLKELKTLGLCDIIMQQKGNKGGSVINICDYESYYD